MAERVEHVPGRCRGTGLDQMSTELIPRGVSIPRTIEIRLGHAFSMTVSQDLVLPGPYDYAVHPLG